MARASPSDATLHEHAEKDFRCCRAMKMAPTCTMPCCFCVSPQHNSLEHGLKLSSIANCLCLLVPRSSQIETIVPWLKPHDCESTTALRQAAWWRKKKLHHADVTSQVEILRRKLEEARREEEEKLHPHPPSALPAPVPTPAAALPSTNALQAAPVASPPVAPPTTTESQVNKDVKSGFLSSLLHP
jgi:hypothetical protein